MLDTRTGATCGEPTRKSDAEERGPKLPRTEWAVPKVEHRREINVHADAA
jgi:hypothetical protein